MWMIDELENWAGIIREEDQPVGGAEDFRVDDPDDGFDPQREDAPEDGFDPQRVDAPEDGFDPQREDADDDRPERETGIEGRALQNDDQGAEGTDQIEPRPEDID